MIMMFMRYMIATLDQESASWRKDTIFLFDGARYHTSAEMRAYFRKLEVQIIYSGPYSYSAASIETLFSSLKKGQLNPEKIGTGRR